MSRRFKPAPPGLTESTLLSACSGLAKLAHLGAVPRQPPHVTSTESLTCHRGVEFHSRVISESSRVWVLFLRCCQVHPASGHGFAREGPGPAHSSRTKGAGMKQNSGGAEGTLWGCPLQVPGGTWPWGWQQAPGLGVLARLFSRVTRAESAPRPRPVPRSRQLALP